MATKTAVGILETFTKRMVERNTKELATIQGNLIAAGRGTESQKILVTSCAPGEGKTTIAITLAIQLSKPSGQTVALVDGNLHTPKIHGMFGTTPAPGLSNWVLGQGVGTAAQEGEGIGQNPVFRKTEFPNLSLLPCGTLIENPINVFRSDHFQKKLAILEQAFTYVIFDAPFYFGPSDTSLITKHFTGVILVVQCEKTRWEVVREVRKKIETVGGNVLGVVLNHRRFYIPAALFKWI